MSVNQVIISKPIVQLSDPFLDLVEKTYLSSFPIEERRDFSLVKDLLLCNDYFKMFALFRDDSYVGFITAWFFNEFIYVEHFAVDESARNGGIGSMAMNSFLSMYDLPVVLEVELPFDDFSKRRIGFYERLGFVLDNHLYLQPPYREGGDAFELRLMSHGNLNLDNSFEEVKSVIHSNVYGVK